MLHPSCIRFAMGRLGWLLLVTGLLLAWPGEARTQEGERSLAERIDAAVEKRMKDEQVVGCAVGLLENNRVVLLKGYGLADREKNTPVDKATLFRWASVSKPLTAIAAMQLVEQGKLNLDADVRDYVPEWPASTPKITARQLLCHQGGIVHYANGKVVRTVRKYDRPHPFEDVVLALDNFKESPLVCEPGTKFSYTTHGYILLSAVVERAGKQKFADQVRERIAQPLGLKTLQPDYQWLDIPRRAVGYRKRQGQVQPSTNTDVSWKLGGGGFLSSIEDFAGFAQGLLRHQLVAEKTATEMWVRQKTADGTETSYGLGFNVARGPNGLFVSHSGSQEKTKTYLALWPEQGRGIVFMTNSEYADPGAYATTIRKAAWVRE